MISN
jgi:carbonic anhydrase